MTQPPQSIADAIAAYVNQIANEVRRVERERIRLLLIREGSDPRHNLATRDFLLGLAERL